MQDFDIVATHSCGHQERHTGGTMGDIEGMFAIFARRKCSACRPMCAFCHRTGDREKMLIAVSDGTPENELAFCNEWCRSQSLKPTYYSEHNDIAIPAFLTGWTDASYHNDMCARSECATVGSAHTVTIWVECDNPADREDPEGPKFQVVFCRDGEFSMEDQDMLYAGDDAVVAAQWAHAAEVACGWLPDTDDEKVLRIRALLDESKKEND